MAAGAVLVAWLHTCAGCPLGLTTWQGVIQAERTRTADVALGRERCGVGLGYRRRRGARVARGRLGAGRVLGRLGRPAQCNRVNTGPVPVSIADRRHMNAAKRHEKVRLRWCKKVLTKQYLQNSTVIKKMWIVSIMKVSTFVWALSSLIVITNCLHEVLS